MEEIRDDISTKVSETKDSVGGFLTSKKGSDSAVAEHPVGLVGGSAAAGAVLGWMTGSSARDSRGDDRRGERDEHQDGRNKRRLGVRRLFSAVMTSGVSVATTEATQVAKSVASGAIHAVSGGGDDGEKPVTRYMARDRMPEPLTSAHSSMDPHINELAAEREATIAGRADR